MQLSDLLPKIKDTPREVSGWHVLEELKKRSDIPLTILLATLADLMRTLLPDKTNLQKELEGIRGLDKGDSEKLADAKAVIAVAQDLLLLAPNNLEREIRSSINDYYFRSWPFWIVVVGIVTLFGTLVGVDLSYAKQAREFLRDMEKQLVDTRNQVSGKTADLNDILKDAKKNMEDARSATQKELDVKSGKLDQILKDAKTSMEGTQKEINDKLTKLNGILKDATDKIQGQAKKLSEESEPKLRAAWIKKIEELEREKLGIHQIPWGRWVLGGTGILSIASFVISIIALCVAIFRSTTVTPAG